MQQKRTALPPSADTKSDTCGWGWERFAGKSAYGVVCNATHARQALQFGSGPRRPQKKTWGVKKKTRVWERDLRGQRASPQNTLAALRPEEGPQKGRVVSSPPKFRENPKKKKPKRTGPRKAPRQNARKKGRTARMGDKTSAAGTKQKKRETDQEGAVWSVPCDYLSFISQKQRKNKTKEKRSKRHRNKT